MMYHDLEDTCYVPNSVIRVVRESEDLIGEAGLQQPNAGESQVFDLHPLFEQATCQVSCMMYHDFVDTFIAQKTT